TDSYAPVNLKQVGGQPLQADYGKASRLAVIGVVGHIISDTRLYVKIGGNGPAVEALELHFTFGFSCQGFALGLKPELIKVFADIALRVQHQRVQPAVCIVFQTVDHEKKQGLIVHHDIVAEVGRFLGLDSAAAAYN